MKKDTIRNIGILAHVDAGKTTIAENMLYISGCIKKIGRVDNGTTQTDSLSLERQRGISIRNASASFKWKENMINLIDTPGHADFYAEVERTISLLDGAILVISAAEGIQAQTKVIWTALKAINIPTIIFINKVDRMGANVKETLRMISDELSNRVLPMQYLQENDGKIEIVSYLNNCKYIPNERMRAFYEECALLDEDILEEYSSKGKAEFNLLQSKLAKLCKSREVFPIYLGSALKSLGVKELLDAVISYIPPCEGNQDNDFSAVVYKIDNDNVKGRLSYIRVFNGCINDKEIVKNTELKLEEKAIRLFKVEGTKLNLVSSLKVGEIGAIAGISAKIGNILGNINGSRKPLSISEPLLTVKIETTNPNELPKLVVALHQLEEEEPLLHSKWIEEKREINIHLMGKVQMEVISGILEERFSIGVRFGDPYVLYKETPKVYSEGYTDKGEYTQLGLSIEPIARGSGIKFNSEISTDFIFRKYQHEVVETLNDALKNGIFGYEVTDVLVKIISGKSTPIATLPSDFRDMTYIAIYNALHGGKTNLLEPFLEFKLCVPQECSKRIFSILVATRSEFENTKTENENMYFVGCIPVATSIDFPTKIASITGGRGLYVATFKEYREFYNTY